MSLILASTSPRRRELLAAVGVDFEIVPSPAEEIHDASMAPHELCEWNATLKAAAVAEFRPEGTVIGADTLVFLDGVPLGKPADLAVARETLHRLSGRTHQVCTGVCVVRPGEAPVAFHEFSDVTFHLLDDAAITEYFTLVDPLDKAGAYGIQEHGERVVAGISGSFDNVMGLPVARLMEVLG